MFDLYSSSNLRNIKIVPSVFHFISRKMCEFGYVMKDTKKTSLRVLIFKQTASLRGAPHIRSVQARRRCNLKRSVIPNHIMSKDEGTVRNHKGIASQSLH